jgi:prepilin-type N-terminal cleavage/methylation domain-containing protein
MNGLQRFFQKKQNGFTLTELIVVLTIMTVVGAVAFANFGTFNKNQNLQKNAENIISLLREAQSNARSGVTCQSTSNKGWFVEFKLGGKDVNMYCNDASGVKIPQKTLTILDPGINVEQAASCNFDYVVHFPPLNGDAQFDNCSNIPNIEIPIKNTASNPVETKTITVDKGGSIDLR